MEKKVLLTGFDPFGGEPVNPAFDVLKFLDGKVLEGHSVVTQEIPTVRHKSLMVLKKAVARVEPALVVAVGQAGGRCEITPERVAINVDDFRIPDNEGHQPTDEPVIEGAPAAHFTRLPVKAMVAAMRAAGIPASVSNSAGTFVCNHVFYGLMHLLSEERRACRGGFIHIPYLPEQAARLGVQPSMAVETVAAGLEIALKTALTVKQDIRETGGEIA